MRYLKLALLANALVIAAPAYSQPIPPGISAPRLPDLPSRSGRGTAKPVPAPAPMPSLDLDIEVSYAPPPSRMPVMPVVAEPVVAPVPVVVAPTPVVEAPAPVVAAPAVGVPPVSAPDAPAALKKITPPQEQPSAPAETALIPATEEVVVKKPEAPAALPLATTQGSLPGALPASAATPEPTQQSVPAVVESPAAPAPTSGTTVPAVAPPAPHPPHSKVDAGLPENAAQVESPTQALPAPDARPAISTTDAREPAPRALAHPAPLEALAPMEVVQSEPEAPKTPPRELPVLSTPVTPAAEPSAALARDASPVVPDGALARKLDEPFFAESNHSAIGLAVGTWPAIALPYAQLFTEEPLREAKVSLVATPSAPAVPLADGAPVVVEAPGEAPPPAKDSTAEDAPLELNVKPSQPPVEEAPLELNVRPSRPPVDEAPLELKVPPSKRSPSAPVTQGPTTPPAPGASKPETIPSLASRGAGPIVPGPAVSVPGLPALPGAGSRAARPEVPPLSARAAPRVSIVTGGRDTQAGYVPEEAELAKVAATEQAADQPKDYYIPMACVDYEEPTKEYVVGPGRITQRSGAANTLSKYTVEKGDSLRKLLTYWSGGEYTVTWEANPNKDVVLMAPANLGTNKAAAIETLMRTVKASLPLSLQTYAKNKVWVIRGAIPEERCLSVE